MYVRNENCVVMMAPIKLEDEAASRAKLVDSLSASYPSQALSKAFLNMDPDDSEGERDPLSSSCYAEIRLDKVKLEDLDSDDELTSLSWLQDTDLLRNIRMDSGTGSVEEDEGEQKENDLTYTNSGIYGVPHPPHVPYNPQKHVNSKPPYSFSCLIFMSIEDSPDKKLPVKDIYNWILTHFPYFQNAPTGWKNSVRHNLSLNKCFKKVEKDRCSNIGKGSLWMIDPDFRPNLLQALRKTPYHPYHQLQMFNNSPTTTNFGTNTGNDQKPFPLQPRYNVNTPSPHLFPFLSRRLAQSSYDGTSPSESSISVSDIDVANTLVSLKRAAESRRPNSTQSEGSRSRSPSPPEFGSEREKELLKQKKYRSSRSDSPIVCYALPSDDHAYCITQEMIQGSKSPESSIDEEYEFGNNDKSLSDDYGIYSESDYDEEGWSEEEELYNKEKMKLSRTSYHHHHHNNNNQKLPSQKPIIVKRGGHHYSSRNNNNNISKGSSPPLKIVTTVSRSTSTKNTQKKVQQSVLSSSSASSVSSSSRDEDEDMKLAEGANALLNLAGIKTAHIVPLRSISPSSNNVNNNNNNVLKKIDFASVAQAVATAAVKDAGKSGEKEKDLSLQHVKEAGCASENSMELSTENSTAESSSEEDKMSLVGVCGVPPLMEITSIKGEDNCQEEDMET